MEIQLDLGENWFDPPVFVDSLAYAEDLGFRTAWFGDHFMPWFHSGNRSQFVWSTLGVAMARTSSIKTGPLVSPPIGARYHPAIVAQASATLDSLFPGRFLLGVGTGEALNERPFWNGEWPNWEERMNRLTEGVRLIRKLWGAKKPFSFQGKYFRSEFMFLYTKPKRPIPIYFAAAGKRAAYFAGKYGDKLVTLSPRNSLERIAEVILPSYRKGVRDRGRGEGGFVVHLDFSMMTPKELRSKHWRALGWMSKDSWSIQDPVAVEDAGKKVTLDKLRKEIHFVKNWRGLVGVLELYKKAGAEAVVLITEADRGKIRQVAKNILEVF
jgi:coenzyme F420-dependent glucose-6-phosphate dehydrogenase